ncbi:tetratricopeptide repeat protein [Glycomyces xiaoerkulensis]|uniref:tetratricopeptide repeat protein n=1 Tax=Glycomyces xiaoerkulensis TaxID=2038139 RepID=UPI000C25EC18|nr:tetratricopeptide repeat protein [Glycomyces xiaoerkulensis]
MRYHEITDDQIAAFIDSDARERRVPEETQRLRDAEELLAKRDPLGALESLEPLLAEHRDHPDVMLTAARAYFKSAQLNRCLALAERMVEDNPADFYARRLLGRTLERLGRRKEARGHLRMVDRIAD